MLRAETLRLAKGKPVDVAAPGPRATTVAFIRPVDGVVYLRDSEGTEKGLGVPLSPTSTLEGLEVGTSEQVWLEAAGDDQEVNVEILVEAAGA